MTRRRDEPLTLTVDVVAGELEHLGYERMASFVRDLGNGVANANRRRQWAEDDAKKLWERLQKYEPVKPWEPVPSGKPGNMSDG